MVQKKEKENRRIDVFTSYTITIALTKMINVAQSDPIKLVAKKKKKKNKHTVTDTKKQSKIQMTIVNICNKQKVM